jgi:hypothetical protein
MNETLQQYVVSYPGTGYEFHIVRCKTEVALREYFRFRGMTQIGPAGQTLNGYTGWWLVFGHTYEIHIAVIETDDERENVRRWAHEIQHAASFVGQSLDPKSFDLGRREELPALSAELLADTVLLMARGQLPGTCPESGFPNAFNGTRNKEEDGALERETAGTEPA